MFLNLLALTFAKSTIRWLNTEKQDGINYAIVNVEEGKPGDKIYLMENSRPDKPLEWVPKHYYVLEKEPTDTIRLALPESDCSKAYALALQDKNGSPTEQPRYSRAYRFDEKNMEAPWQPVDNGRFDPNANAASVAAGSKPSQNGESKGGKTNGGKKGGKSVKSTKNSAIGVFSSVTAVAVILASMLM